MKRALIAAMLASSMMPMTARAYICDIPLSEANAGNAHSTDEANDWEGVAFGNGSATIPAGDVYREGTDLVAAWLSEAEDGTVQANMKVADLGTGVMANAIFYMLWTSGTGPESQRFASVRFKGYENAYSYGYQTTNPVTGNGLFFTSGDTTGSVDVENDTVIVNLPEGTPWGSPEPGSTIIGIKAESRILVGSPEPLPSNPANLRHGFVYVADVTEEWCSATV